MQTFLLHSKSNSFTLHSHLQLQPKSILTTQLQQCQSTSSISSSPYSPSVSSSSLSWNWWLNWWPFKLFGGWCPIRNRYKLKTHSLVGSKQIMCRSGRFPIDSLPSKMDELLLSVSSSAVRIVCSMGESISDSILSLLTLIICALQKTTVVFQFFPKFNPLRWYFTIWKLTFPDRLSAQNDIFNQKTWYSTFHSAM